MQVSSVVFDRSAPDLEWCPDESLPEFAFIGRSNVGKSSLLNMLVRQQGLASVSATPGHTKLINFFTVSGTWRLVDLPGYGYAQVARADKTKFNRAVNRYLAERPNLRGVFVLIDSQLPPQPIDLEFLQLLTQISAPIVLVFTKTDRASPTKVRTSIEAFKEAIEGWYAELPEIFTASSKTGEGRTELLGAIAAALAEARAAAPKPAAAAARRPTPKPSRLVQRHRPW